MPRLTKEQAIEYYGRNLPTPTIDKITLSNVESDDEIYEIISRAVRRDVETSDLELEETVTRIDVDVSFYFSTDENFAVKDFEKTLFDKQLGEGMDSEPMYITLNLMYDAISPDTRIFKTDIIRSFDIASETYSSLISAYPPGTLNYNELGISETALGGTTINLISRPLSDFHSVAELTSEIDADDNSVIRVTNIKLTTYVKNFSAKENINAFCCVSAKHPYEIQTPTAYSLDPITISMNYGDVTYEQIIRNGSLATFSEPVYVDSEGLHYPGHTLAALNRKYYKTPDFGATEIYNSVSALLAEFEPRVMFDEELESVTNEIKSILEIHREGINFLQNLNKAAQGFSLVLVDSEALPFTTRLRAIINNSDATLRTQEEVVQRTFRNYKIVDARRILSSDLTAFSYVSSLTDADLLYQNIYNTTIANYVPMITAGSDYPGKAELPATPSEIINEYSEDLLTIRNQLHDVMTPFSRLADASAPSFSELTYVGITSADTPAAYAGPVTATASSPMKEKIDALVKNMADWCYNVWAGRFIKGSQHPAYQNADGHSGAHYYIAQLRSFTFEGLPVVSGELPVSRWNWTPARDNFSDTGFDTWREGRAPWQGEIERWDGLLESVPWATWKGDLPEQTARLEKLEIGRYSYGASSGLGGDPGDRIKLAGDTSVHQYYDAVQEKFGYRPSSTTSLDARPDNSPRDGGPAYKIRIYEHRLPEPEEGLGWIDAYFGSGTEDEPGFSGGVTSETAFEWSWFDPYFYTAAAPKDVESLYLLAQQEHQIEFFVPKDGSGAQATLEETIERSLATTAFGDLIEDLDGESTLRYQFGNKYMSDYYEKVGGVSPLYKNSNDTAEKRQARSLAQDVDKYDNDEYEKPYGPMWPIDSTIGWWRCARKKYNNIYTKIEETFYSIFGIDPDTMEFVAGTAAIVDGPESIDTNTGTVLDTYISEGPFLIIESAISQIFDKIDNRPPDDFDTEAERDNWADIFTEQLIEKTYVEAQKYYDKKFCKVIACTALPDEPITTYWSDKTEESFDDRALPYPREIPEKVKVRELDYNYTALGGNSGEDVYPNIVYGYWGGLCSSMALNATGFPALADTHIVNLGQTFIDIIREHTLLRRPQIREQIKNYITTRGLFTGLNSDIGIHSALAEVDIVLSKYGYFFFDMEKYIRKRSHISKVINVDRFLNNFSGGKSITNAACRLKEVTVEMNNFGTDPITGLPTTERAATLQLLKDESTATTTSFVNDFKMLTFKTPVDPLTDRPRIYRKINALQAISFDQITEYTNARDTVTTGEASETLREESIRVLGSSAGAGAVVTGGSYSLSGAPTGGSTAESLDALGTAAAEQQDDLAVLAAGVERAEVDIEGLVEDIQYAPKILHTGLVMRNYAFPGFSDAALLAGKKWRSDYRLMMFRYQFFMDDDDAFRFSGDPELDDGMTSYDNMIFKVKIVDHSLPVFEEMVRTFTNGVATFKELYVDLAEEACAFNSFDQNFNQFFVDRMNNDYPSPPDTPWHNMVALFISYVNILTDKYRGDTLLMYETGTSMLEMIQPQTGNLLSLRNFYEECTSLQQKLQDSLERLIDLVTQFEFEFVYEDVIGASVIDHIGDYSDRLEDPRISEFGGDEDLYDFEDF